MTEMKFAGPILALGSKGNRLFATPASEYDDNTETGVRHEKNELQDQVAGLTNFLTYSKKLKFSVGVL
jgi:hypothetical protein